MSLKLEGFENEFKHFFCLSAASDRYDMIIVLAPGNNSSAVAA